MRQNWKRYTAVVTMLVLVCAAAALNWQATREASPQDGGTEPAAASSGAERKILGESKLVSAPDGELEGGEDAVYTGSDYFASARLTRQQARDNAVALLQQAAAAEGAEQDTLDQASEGIQAMARFTTAEAQIENLVTAKGYADCVAFMADDSVSVVVSTATGELTGDDIAKITDIAMTETGLPAGAVKIMAAD